MNSGDGIDGKGLVFMKVCLEFVFSSSSFDDMASTSSDHVAFLCRLLSEDRRRVDDDDFLEVEDEDTEGDTELPSDFFLPAAMSRIVDFVRNAGVVAVGIDGFCLCSELHPMDEKN